MSKHAIALVAALSVVVSAQAPRSLDRTAERWVQDTFKKMSVEEKFTWKPDTPGSVPAGHPITVDLAWRTLARPIGATLLRNRHQLFGLAGDTVEGINASRKIVARSPMS